MLIFGWRSILKVYPRVCGGTTRCRQAKSLSDGLSPRVRGNLHPDLA